MLSDPLAARSLQDCGLPAAWASSAAWTVLDTQFDAGERFLDIWQAWRQDPRRPRILHYVGIAEHTDCVSCDPLPAPPALPQITERQLLAQELAAHCLNLEPGFHRISLAHGAVSLTLCLGSVDAMLGEHVFQADTLYAHAPANKWTAQLLARRCRRGARFCVVTKPDGFAASSSELHCATLLRGAGFQLDDTADPAGIRSGRFDPRWDIPNSRSPARHEAPTPARCAVIGAGIAGASVAHAMALRGWQVTVLDQEAVPAGGASSLPAGLAVPHVSADDSPRSRITRRGIRLMVQHAGRLLSTGQDWEQSGVVERRPGDTALLHPDAAWVKPHRLVQAWLTHKGITFVGNTKVVSLQHSDGLWSLCDESGKTVGPFEAVVVANAMGCTMSLNNIHGTGLPERADLIHSLSALQAIHGTLSHGSYAEAIPDLPAIPVNGNGCFIPHVPDAAGEKWCAGSTFETDPLAAADLWTQHTSNMDRLQQLLPGVGFTLAETLDRGPVAQWSATRCVTHDRLPLVGPVGRDQNGGLWLSVGMGSRGLSFSALCAELLVARLCAEPWPVEFSLSRSLDSNRVRHKRRSNVSAPPAG